MLAVAFAAAIAVQQEMLVTATTLAKSNC